MHNARKANSSVINLIGDHATYHKKYDAPLNSDVVGLAKPVSHWVKSVATAEVLPKDAAEAAVVANEKPGKIATLIIPADCAWNESVAPEPKQALPTIDKAGQDAVRKAAELLTNGKVTYLLMSNLALSEKALASADQISQATRARIFCDTFTPMLPRGEGRCDIERLGYFAEQATEQLQGAEQMVMVGTKAPVGFLLIQARPANFIHPDVLCTR